MANLDRVTPPDRGEITDVGPIVVIERTIRPSTRAPRNAGAHIPRGHPVQGI
jgi:hypothetical protein